LVGGTLLKDSIMTVIRALLALAILLVSAAATAAPGQQSKAVEAGDLDLGSDEGQRVLALRIQRAARAMCRAQVSESLPQNIRSERKCIREAQASVEGAVKTMTAASEAALGKGG
jgi:UrcA family protein